MNSLCLLIVDGRNYVLKHLGKKSVKMPKEKGQKDKQRSTKHYMEN